MSSTVTTPVFFTTVGAAGTVTDAEKAELQKEFSGYDLNHDDVIDEEELKKVREEGTSVIPAQPPTLLYAAGQADEYGCCYPSAALSSTVALRLSVTHCGCEEPRL